MRNFDQVNSSVRSVGDYEPSQDLDVKEDFYESDDDDLDLEAFESAFGSDSFTTDEEVNGIVHEENSSRQHSSVSSHENLASLTEDIEFLGNFDEFDDLGNTPNFDISKETNQEDTSLFSETSATSNTSNNDLAKDLLINSTDDDTHENEELPKNTSINIDKITDITQNANTQNTNTDIRTSDQQVVTDFTLSDVATPESKVNVKKGLFGLIKNASLETKQWYIACTVGLTSAVAVLLVSFGVTEFSRSEQRELAKTKTTDWIMALSAGLTGAITSGVMGNLVLRQVRRNTKDFQSQFDAVKQGNLNILSLTSLSASTALSEQQRIYSSKTFTKTLSGDVLQSAIELAEILNSVQVIREYIKRVAGIATEVEVVAGDAKLITLKGREVVENSVMGILEVQETLVRTTRKVKRLVESSQEINSIVAVVSLIASKTNLLAINASIEAARAGESEKGFAVIADELRHLAHKSAKSLKEIEQIVMQIQSESGSVMTGMEESTQQVIKATKLGEEANKSLEEVIEVIAHVDSLVRSLADDTVGYL